jgi:DNA-binding CsgD family transcriptional regulator/GAF domain-containing protein
MGAGPGLAERRIADLVRRCYAGLGAAQLQHEVLARLRKIVPVDAAFFATVDPVTLLFTGAVAEDPLGAATPLFVDNEFGRADVNKFAVLAAPGGGGSEGRARGARISSLDRATRGDRAASHRYREIMAPLGLGDELRAALVAGQHCWGVLCLHREDSPAGFTDRELRMVQQIAPHVAEGLRRAVAAGSRAGGEDASGEPVTPGIIVLDADLAAMSVSTEASYWVAELAHLPGSRLGELPVPVYAAAARLARAEQQPDPAVLPTVRVRTRGGRWLAVHATRLTGPAGPQTGVVLETASPAQLSSLFLSAYGLTPAQVRVAGLVLQGYSTRQITGQLHISANTVQEHLTAVFDKVGVRSRRELAATLLSGRPRP